MYLDVFVDISVCLDVFEVWEWLFFSVFGKHKFLYSMRNSCLVVIVLGSVDEVQSVFGLDFVTQEFDCMWLCVA